MKPIFQIDLNQHCRYFIHKANNGLKNTDPDYLNEDYIRSLVRNVFITLPDIYNSDEPHNMINAVCAELEAEDVFIDFQSLLKIDYERLVELTTKACWDKQCKVRLTEIKAGVSLHQLDFFMDLEKTVEAVQQQNLDVQNDIEDVENPTQKQIEQYERSLERGL